VLKIDKSFTSAIGIDSVNATVTDMIIALAHRLNIVTVAEGVETQEQEEYLRATASICCRDFTMPGRCR
jgi:sensor c-di-GMP phosphodiesterase-like protein